MTATVIVKRSEKPQFGDGLTQLVFADVHELLGRGQFGGGAALDVGFHLAACS